MEAHHTVEGCLESIGVGRDDLSDCESLALQWSVIKKQYFQKILVCHPDKGGDASEFREVQTSFEVLRELYDAKRVDSFEENLTTKIDENYDQAWKDFGGTQPSWEYYYEAAEEAIPTYKVEPAKTGRSKCKQKGKAKHCEDATIAQGEIRIGSLDEQTGSYAWWKHLTCWRVPTRVWQGIPDPEQCTDTHLFEKALLGMNEVLLCGFSELSPEQRQEIVAYVMDKKNWSRKTIRKPKIAAAPEPVPETAPGSGEEAATGFAKAAGTTIVPKAQRQHFVVPVPGKHGAIANSLSGKTVVLTGVFPEVGGGMGLGLGKDKVKAMVEKFGGRVTSSISGKTDILLVGKEPGFSKVSKAREKPKIRLISLDGLVGVIQGGLLKNAPPAPILSFSAGYITNSKLLTAPRDEPRVDSKPAPKEDSKPAANKTKPAKEKKRTPAALKAKPPAKKKARKAAPKKSKKEPQAHDITCDGCGADCTDKSWFVEATEEDFCPDCHEKEGKEGAVLQSNGITI